MQERKALLSDDSLTIKLYEILQ